MFSELTLFPTIGHKPSAVMAVGDCGLF